MCLVTPHPFEIKMSLFLGFSPTGAADIDSMKGSVSNAEPADKKFFRFERFILTLFSFE